jgi:poly-gamma-glutamate capsule biosynthesis protein CapA/YwtB (metallophosphatase superfamily)
VLQLLTILEHFAGVACEVEHEARRAGLRIMRFGYSDGDAKARAIFDEEGEVAVGLVEFGAHL